jgi:hypothetical protein
MIEDMQLHGYAAKTQTAYIGAVRGLAKYYKRNPEDITGGRSPGLFSLAGERKRRGA